MKAYKADMHIHSCLSPCGDLDMSPKGIVEKCLEKGLDLIAICDHNTVENAEAIMLLGKRGGLCVLPGMEVCSKEEAHILAIFGNMAQASQMQSYVYEHLPGVNNAELWGPQIVANEDDEVMGENNRLLIGATTLSVHQIVEKTHAIGGLSIASHVDRSAFGIVSQLGFIPPDLALDGVEVSFRLPIKEARSKIRSIGKLPCITSSDAHFLSDIGKIHTTLVMAEVTFEEIVLALKGADGRYIVSD